MVPDLAAALQPRGEATKGSRPGGATRRRRLGRRPGEAPSSRACPAPGARAPPEPEGEPASEVGDDRRQWSESLGSRKEPRTCPHAVPTVRSGAADTEENSIADSGRHRLL